MGRLSSDGMAAVERDQVKRREALTALTSEPFDLTNKAHLDALTAYNNHFEYSVSQMYLYQGMSEGLKVFAGGWFIGLILPTPDFIKYFMSSFLYLGAAGFILERFSMNDFNNDLAEMKVLYNWCCKDGQEHYAPHIDNTDKLAKPQVQRLIKLISPLCTVDYMLVWPRELAKTEEVKTGWSNVLSLGLVAASSTFSLFTRSKPGVNLTQIRELKRAVETEELNLGVIKGVQQALNYFATSPDFRELLTNKLGAIKNIIPQFIASQTRP